MCMIYASICRPDGAVGVCTKGCLRPPDWHWRYSRLGVVGIGPIARPFKRTCGTRQDPGRQMVYQVLDDHIISSLIGTPTNAEERVQRLPASRRDRHTPWAVLSTCAPLTLIGAVPDANVLGSMVSGSGN